MLDESIFALGQELANFNDAPHNILNFVESVTNYNFGAGTYSDLEYLCSTDGNDLLLGTANEDTIYGLEENDLIFGLSGNDILSGNQGLDLIAGGKGDDWIGGGADRDPLIGNDGNDTLVGGAGDDYLWGGKDNDSLQGQSGNDRIWGDRGDDLLDGGAGFDLLFAGQGNDIVIDLDGGDRLTGGKGEDEFRIGHSLSDAPSTITDFQIGKDELKILRLGATFNDLTIQNSQNGALILDGNREIAVLQGIDAASLNPDDFLFGNAALAEELQSAINQTVADYNLPGVSVSVIAPDGTTWTGTEGFSNLEANTPLNPDDRFVIASTTKMFVATTVLQLVEEGNLSLEDTMSQWLPDIASQIPNGDIITVRQLLNHTSGIREVNDDLVEAIVADQKRALEEWTTEELIALIYDKAPTSEPGQYGYSNTNYLLLGEIVETATDSTLKDQLESRIFEPLGLDNTFYEYPSEIPGGYVNGYQLNENGMLENTNPQYHPSLVVQADGGIISTPTDLARFAQGLFAGEILTPTSLDLMVPDRAAPRRSRDRDSSGYGLGVVYEESPDYGRLQGHDGALDVLGWRSFLFNLPEQNLTVAITSNTYSYNGDPIVELLATIVRETVQQYSDNNDLLMGTANDDTLSGLESNDSILGREGKDILSENQGLEPIVGGEGDDWLNGGADSDSLIGSSGNDTLVGGADDDYLWGGKDNDSLQGQSGSDRIWGDRGDDLLDGGAGFDLLFAGQGNDIVIDLDGGDRLTGGSGADEFRLGNGRLPTTPKIAIFPPVPDFTVTDFEVEQDVLTFNFGELRFDDLIISQDERGAIVSVAEREALVLLEGIEAEALSESNFRFGDIKLVNNLQQTLDEVIADSISPGATTFVVTEDGQIWSGATGLSDVENGTITSVEDRFNIASVTKTFTATVILQLMQEGKLTLEDTLDRWLPDSIVNNIPYGEQITIRQLLSHSSGIYDYDESWLEDALKDPSLITKDWSPQELLTNYVYGQQALFAPGTSAEYSNTNYILLGLIIEEATNSDLATEYRNRIFEPLGLENTFLAEEEAIPGGYQPGYFDLDGDGQLENVSATNLSIGWAAGAIISNIEDLARFIQGLYGGELLAPDTLDEMINGGVEVEDGAGFGLGVIYNEYPDLGTILLTTGDSPLGHATQVWYSQESGATVIAITNGEAISRQQPDSQLRDAILKVLLEQAA